MSYYFAAETPVAQKYFKHSIQYSNNIKIQTLSIYLYIKLYFIINEAPLVFVQ